MLVKLHAATRIVVSAAGPQTNGFANISNKCIREKFSDLLRILIPFTPHLAHECLEQIGETNINKWPLINNKLILDEKIKIAIQINGKTREIIEVKKNLDEKNAIIESKKNKKVSDSLAEKEIIKTIFIKNKIINYLIK